MHNRFTKRGLTTLLLLALLIVGVAILLPIVASADVTPAASGEIEDLNYQTVNGTNVKTSEETDLRFLFSIDEDKLNVYTAVGFVFSTSGTDPVKVDSPKVNYKSVTKVYRSVTANSKDIPAPDGRYWVAVNLSEIPHESFATEIYVRPFVEDGEGTRYGETKRINVCEALGHSHTIVNPTEGTATLVTAGTAIGHCDGCNLDSVTQYNVRAELDPSVVRYKSGEACPEKFDENILVANALASGQQYFPDEENDDEGRDFYFQIDMLWNETMANCNERFQLCFYNYIKNNSKWNSFFYFFPISINDADCNVVGGFDWTMGKSTLEGPDGGWHKGFDKYPNLRSNSSSMDYGWHRIGVRIHQESKIEGGKAVHSGISYLYIDGVLRWKVDLDTTTMEEKGILLFNRANDGKYSANNNEVYFDFWSDNIDTVKNAVYMVTANPVYKAVKPSDFKDEMTVMPDSDPEEAIYVLPNGNEVSAKIYFRDPEIYDSKHPSGPYVYGVEGNHFFVSKTVEDIKEDKVFHPTSTNSAGNDLWFEYSFLWNDTLSNWDESKSEMMLFGFRNESNKYRDFYYLYTKNNNPPDYSTSGECPFAGHIDYSTYLGNLSYNCAYDLTSEGNGIGLYKAGWDDPITQNSSPYLYDEESQTTGGWHRLGFRYHQEATVDNEKGGVVYTGYTELYINGVKVWKVQTDMQGYWEDSQWKHQAGYKEQGYADLKANGLLLWEAKTTATEEEIAAGWEEYNGLYYKDRKSVV